MNYKTKHKYPTPQVVYPKPTRGIAVDGSCLGNPGISEYRGVDIETGKEIFRTKISMATNNIAEYLSICNAISYCQVNKIVDPVIYTDSMIAKNWILKGYTNSHFDWSLNTELYELFVEAERYVNSIGNLPKIYFWRKKQWSENVADFGRKPAYKAK